MDPSLLQFMIRAKSGRSGGRGRIFSQERGRYVKPMFPKGKVVRLAIDATLRAAAPYQIARRKRAARDPKKAGRKVFVEQPDVRVKRLARKAGGLIIFAVDASGSMALNRMDAAKGAAISLLDTAYKSRDRICLIPFREQRADVLLPPTRSIAMARARLEAMPCGGGTPLAHALHTAVRTGMNAMSTGDVSQCILVLLTDGRGNIPLSVSHGDAVDPDHKPTREEIQEEVMTAARQLGALPSFSVVVLDSEEQFMSGGYAKELATAAGGHYAHLPRLNAGTLATVATAALDAVAK